jgi:uncharacterized delta-60 repeat protein
MTILAACGGGGGGEPARTVTTVTVSSPTATPKQGDTVQLTAVARDQFGEVMPGTTASWSSSAPAVATVSATGLLQALAGGSVTVTATINGVPGTLALIVTPRVTTTVTVGSPAASPSVGETVQLTVVARDQFGVVIQGRPATWSTSDAKAATISPTGLLQAVTPGAVVATATIDGVPGSLTLTVVPGTVASVTVSAPTLTPKVGDSVQLTAVARDPFGNIVPGVTATWTSSDPAVASVTQDGLVRALKKGTATVTATVNDVRGALDLAVTPATCPAAAGDTDTTFATNGMYVYPRSSTSAVGTRQIVVLSSGRLLALGGIGGGPTDGSSYQSSVSFALTSAGVLDTSFGQDGLLPDATTNAHEFLTAEELPSGSLILGSQVLGCRSPNSCSVDDPGPTYRVQRYLFNGTLDSSFGLAGTESKPSHTGNAAIWADGSVAGLGIAYSNAFYPPLHYYRFDAVVLDASGQPDPALGERFLTQMIRCNPSGTADLPGIRVPVVQKSSGDRIIFAHGSCMLQLERDGTPDATFGSGGLSDVDNAGLLVAQAIVLKDGSVLTFSLLADRSSYRVVKRLANGAPDPSFGTGGVIAKMTLPFTPILNYFTPNSRGFPAIDNQDRVLIAGYRTDAETGLPTNYLARFDAQMNLDTSFGSAGSGLATVGNPALGIFTPLTAAIDDMGRIVVAGRLWSGTSDDPYGARYAEAVTRLQGDPVSVAMPPSGGGCFSVRKQRVDLPRM